MGNMRKYSSVYEHLNGGFTTVMKQRFVDEFSGSDEQIEDSGRAWTKHTTGSGTYTMGTTADSGLLMTTGSSTSDQNCIDFGGINQFSNTGCECIYVGRPVESSSRSFTFGLAEDNSGANATLRLRNDNGDYQELITKGSSQTATPTDVATDEAFHSYKMSIANSNAKLSIDGILKATTGSNLPDAGLQPFILIQTNTTAARSCNSRYYEAYNT